MKPNPHHPTSEDLFAYRDGELSAERRSVIEAHVLACADCREQIDAVSEMESDLRLAPDPVGVEYYERLTESVLERVARAERATASAPAEVAPRIERRRPEVVESEIDARRRFHLPWIGIAGTGAAAVAVALVAVFLLQHQEEWKSAPRPVVLDDRADGRAHGADSLLLKRDAAGSGAATEAKESRTAATSKKLTKATAPEPRETGAGGQPPPSVGSVSNGARNQAREEAQQGGKVEVREGESRTAFGTLQTAPQAAAPEAALDAARRSRSASPGTDAYASVIRAHGLPVLWNDQVDPGAVARAEQDLRYIYQTGAAGSDSARVRLYLAEAERARLGSAPESSAIESVAHHYRRAIALAGGDGALIATARRRLAELLAARP